MRDTGPHVRVEQASRTVGPAVDRWLVAWEIQNLGRQPLSLLTARLPHSRFRSEERKLTPTPKLEPGESTRLEVSVTCKEPPETVVENAFLILRVLWLEEPWRVFTRFQVAFDEHGGPRATTELVTTQPVGFSGRGQRTPVLPRTKGEAKRAREQARAGTNVLPSLNKEHPNADGQG